MAKKLDWERAAKEKLVAVRGHERAAVTRFRAIPPSGRAVEELHKIGYAGKRPPTDLGVYLNRIVRWIPEPAQLAPSDHPQVLFMLQNVTELEPAAPTGFRVLGKVRRGRDWWYAFVRE